MTLQYSTTVRNAKLDAIETAIGTAAVLKIRTGSAPANVATADSGTVLATLTLPSDWLAAASSGSKAKSGTWEDLSADTLSATATITQPAVETPVVQPTASGGYGFSSDRPVPPKHLTTLVFSDERPRPVSQEEPPRGLSTAEAPAAEDTASRPSAAAPSPETVAALASTLAGQVEVAALPVMPELIAGNDDEEAMMIILALAA